MKGEIKPGVLCYLVNIPDPMKHNNGRIVEVIKFFDMLGGKREWWVKPQGTVSQARYTAFLGWEFRESDAECTIIEDHLRPISDPELETDDVTSKDLSEVL